MEWDLLIESVINYNRQTFVILNRITFSFPCFMNNLILSNNVIRSIILSYNIASSTMLQVQCTLPGQLLDRAAGTRGRVPRSRVLC